MESIRPPQGTRLRESRGLQEEECAAAFGSANRSRSSCASLLAVISSRGRTARLSRQQVRRSFGRNTKDSAVDFSRRSKSVKPLREQYQRRGRRVSRRVKLCQYRAHRATGLVIRAVSSIVGKRGPRPAHSMRIASPVCASTRAAPFPFHQTINRPPSLSSLRDGYC